MDTTTVVMPGHALASDSRGNFLLSVG
jgi:hypothetical protein